MVGEPARLGDGPLPDCRLLLVPSQGQRDEAALWVSDEGTHPIPEVSALLT